MKGVGFCGSSLDDLRAFPDAARRAAGYQIDRVQHGLDPDDWKPMEAIGAGVREIRLREESGQYRVLYVAKFGDAVYVLHCFKKATQTTRQHDKDTGQRRYRALMKELGL